MSIADVILSMKENLSSAYITLENKGAIIPAQKNIANLSSAIDSITSGGGGATQGKYLCQIIDYDGTVLKSENHNEGDVFTLLDGFPTHDRLIAQGYSSPISVTDNAVIVGNGDITIGITYTTASGLNEFDITLTPVTGLSVRLRLDGTKNWGDGTSDASTSHTYPDYGDYTITCDGTTMTTASDSGGVFLNNGSNNNNYCTNVRLASVSSISLYAFAYCNSLKSITIPLNVTSIGNYAFTYCNSLSSITIPPNVTSTGISGFEYCRSLASIVIPFGVKTINDGAFRYCYSLKSVTIPSSVTSIGNTIFYDCHSLAKIGILSSINSIGNSAFYRCFPIKKYDFSKQTSIPTLSNTGVFTSINGICKIVVPDSLYDQWIAATNWSTYANYIYKKSEIEE